MSYVNMKLYSLTMFDQLSCGGPRTSRQQRGHTWPPLQKVLEEKKKCHPAQVPRKEANNKSLSFEHFSGLDRFGLRSARFGHRKTNDRVGFESKGLIRKLKSGSKVVQPKAGPLMPQFRPIFTQQPTPPKKTGLLPDFSDVLKVRKVRLPQESFRLACLPHCPMWSRIGGFNFHGGNDDQHGSTMRFWGTLF